MRRCECIDEGWRQWFIYQSPTVGQNRQQKLGLPASYPDYVFPGIKFGGLQTGGQFPGNFRAGLISQSIDMVTLIRGRATNKLGVKVRRNQGNQGNTGNPVPCDTGV